MTTNNNLNALFAEAELPFGHPGHRFDNTPEYFDHSPLADQGAEPDYTPEEDQGIVHYGPGNRPLCGNDSITAVYSNDPHHVTGCDECLELVAEDLQTRTPITVATASTASGRSPPPAPSSGAGCSGAHARTAARLDGE